MVARKNIGAEARPISMLLLMTLLKLKTAAKVSDSNPNLPIVFRLVSDIIHLQDCVLLWAERAGGRVGTVLRLSAFLFRC